VDTPEALKGSMRGEVVEIVCNPVRGAFAALKERSPAREVQMFGDRLHAVLDDAGRDLPAVLAELQRSGVAVRTSRRVAPSLENVFISLLTDPHSARVES
jgi:ABC-2 type transport system ATP-binding protein